MTNKQEYKVGDLVLWNGDETQTALILNMIVDHHTNLTVYTVLTKNEILKYPEYVMRNFTVVSPANHL